MKTLQIFPIYIAVLFFSLILKPFAFSSLFAAELEKKETQADEVTESQSVLSADFLGASKTSEKEKKDEEESRTLNLDEPEKDLAKNLVQGDLRYIGYVLNAPVVPGAEGNYLQQFGVWYVDGLPQGDKLRIKVTQYAESYNKLLNERLHQEFDMPVNTPQKNSPKKR